MAKFKPNNKINQNWSYYKIRRLENLSKVGDKDAEKELKTYHNRLVRQSNARLRELQKNGITRYAYEKAQSFIIAAYDKNTRYKLDLKNDYEMMRRQILSMQRFLGYESSTVEGVKAIEDRRINAAITKWFTDDDGNALVSRKDAEDFLRFLGNDAVRRTIIKEKLQPDSSLHFGSGDLVDLIRGKFENSSKDERKFMLEQFNKYQESEEKASWNISNPNRFYYDNLIEYLRGGDKH